MKLLFVAASLLLSLASAAPAMQSPSLLAQITDPADRAVLPEAASAMSSRSPDLAQLDAVLAKLPRPTPLRGMIQTVRAMVLAELDDNGPSIAAIEEALRLLPDDPRPRLVATGIFTFSGAPQRAADLWLQASRDAPGYARVTDAYVVSALLGRLDEIGDQERADRLRARLTEIGFVMGDASERSNVAAARVQRDILAGEVGDVTTAIASVGNPIDLLPMYLDRRFEAAWPQIDRWVGAGWEAISLRYLSELRAEWEAADTFTTATPYARALARAGAYNAVTTLFLPMFERLQPGKPIDDAEFLAPIVARALYRQNRAAEADLLLAKVAATFPKEDGGARLNLIGVSVTDALFNQRWAEVITHADAFLARAKPLGRSVNTGALLAVEQRRNCALWRSGRVEEAEQGSLVLLMAEALHPEIAYGYLICTNRDRDARALIIRRLNDESTRSWALRQLQPDARPPETAFGRSVIGTEDAVRNDPTVRAAAAKVGRILPTPILGSLPTGFDPFRAPAPRRALGPGDV